MDIIGVCLILATSASSLTILDFTSASLANQEGSLSSAVLTNAPSEVLPERFILCSSTKSSKIDGRSAYVLYGADGNPWLTFSSWNENNLSHLWVDVNFGHWHSLLKLEKPLTHKWMTICADIDTNTGNISVSLNGRTSMTMIIESLKINKPEILVLEVGLSKLHPKDGGVKQFSGLVANIHISKIDKNISIEILSSNPCNILGDYLSWIEASFELKGQNVIQTEIKDQTECLYQQSKETKLILSTKYARKEARHSCDILGDGRISGVNDENELQEYLKLMKESQVDCIGVWLPLSDDEEEGVFRNIYTHQIETYLPWSPEQPSGGTSQNSVILSLVTDGYIDDYNTEKRCVSCILGMNPTFRLRGVCKQSYLGEL